MNTTIVIDDELLAKARKYSDLQGNTELVQEALKAFVEREAARRMAGKGGSDPTAEAAPRRRPEW